MGRGTQVLRQFIWLLTFWLKKPLVWWVRINLAPSRTAETLQIDAGKAVVYILPTRSYVDAWVLEEAIRQAGLPLIRKSDELPKPGSAAALYLPAVMDRDKTLMRLFRELLDAPDPQIQLVPVSVFWGRDPGSETSVFRLLFSDAESPGYIRKGLIILANGRNVVVNFGQPAQLSELTSKDTDYERVARKLVRVFRVHFRRARIATLGPSLSRLNNTVRAVLANPEVRDTMSQIGKDEGRSRAEMQARVRTMVTELAADYSTTTLRVLAIILSWIWNRVYDGVEVHRISRCREAASQGGVLYMASHRSHMDYLLMSYVLYNEGLVPPHIAAGINLNFWPMGPILRRGGAFFLRRTFKGNPLYTAVFRAYLDVLVSRGYPISFYPEGGRSRTGRLLKPKTGMLAMLSESWLRNPDKPLTIIPVHLGYDKVMEVNSYFKELRGTRNKAKESIWELAKASRILSRKYGKAHVSFGEPLDLRTWIAQNHPDWLQQAEEDRANFSHGIGVLADTVMRRINEASVLGSGGLCALSLLTTPQRAIDENELIEQIDQFRELQRIAPYSEQLITVDEPATSLIAEYEPIAPLERAEHEWGDLLLAQGRSGVLMTYTRNSVAHLFAVPSLLANFFRSPRTRYREQLISDAADYYPFLENELHLRHPASKAAEVLSVQLDALISCGLVIESEGRLRAPSIDSPAYARLIRLANIVREALERYALSALLLDQQPRDMPIDRTLFEQTSRSMIERMAILTGRDAPEFFDKALLANFFDTLERVGLASCDAGPTVNDCHQIRIAPEISEMARGALKLVGPDISQVIVQLVRHVRSASREPSAPAAD